jgi:hypothetical protein
VRDEEVVKLTYGLIAKVRPVHLGVDLAFPNVIASLPVDPWRIYGNEPQELVDL